MILVTAALILRLAGETSLASTSTIRFGASPGITLTTHDPGGRFPPVLSPAPPVKVFGAATIIGSCTTPSVTLAPAPAHFSLKMGRCGDTNICPIKSRLFHEA